MNNPLFDSVLVRKESVRQVRKYIEPVMFRPSLSSTDDHKTKNQTPILVIQLTGVPSAAMRRNKNRS